MSQGKHFALLTSYEPLHGRCPVCGGVMDETGCRLGETLVSKDASRTHGIAQIVEVLTCTGKPLAPVVACPGCAEKP